MSFTLHRWDKERLAFKILKVDGKVTPEGTFYIDIPTFKDNVKPNLGEYYKFSAYETLASFGTPNAVNDRNKIKSINEMPVHLRSKLIITKMQNKAE